MEKESYTFYVFLNHGSVKSLLKFGNFGQTLTRLKNGLSIADFSIRQV